MKKQIISIALLISIFSCKSDDNEIKELTQEPIYQCNCIRKDYIVKLNALRGYKVISDELDYEMLTCEEETNGRVFRGSNENNRDTIVTQTWREVICPK